VWLSECCQKKGIVEKGLCHRREFFFLDAQRNFLTMPPASL